MRVLGIDIGSRVVKIAVFKDNFLESSKMIDTAAFYREFCRNTGNSFRVDFERIGIEGIDKVVSTGYGRNNVNIEGAEIIVELKAHTFGAVWQTKLENFTLLDIGGQDSKVILVEKGRMADMVLNDKCAASCGRYLENMANVLGIKLSQLEEHYSEPVELNSTCAVFSESELIGRISEGYPMEKLAAGVNNSLFKRIKPLIERFPKDRLVITGGVAGNKALINLIKGGTGFREVSVPEFPQLNGAIGCCVYGMRP